MKTTPKAQKCFGGFVMGVSHALSDVMLFEPLCNTVLIIRCNDGIRILFQFFVRIPDSICFIFSFRNTKGRKPLRLSPLSWIIFSDDAAYLP